MKKRIIFYSILTTLLLGVLVIATTTISDDMINTDGKVILQSGLNLTSGRGENGEDTLRLFPLNETTGYTQIAFYPEANYSKLEGDVLINVHNSSNDLTEEHNHLSIYTTRSNEFNLEKRFDLEYGADYADLLWSNIDEYTINANRVQFSDTNGTSSWGWVDFHKSGASILFDFNPNSTTPTDSANIRFFRDTVQTGDRLFLIYRGDGSSTTTFYIDAQTGTIMKMGTINQSLQIGDGQTQKNLTLTSPNGSEYSCGVADGGTFSCT